MLIDRKSPLSGNINSMEIDVTDEQLDRYYSGGESVQNVFPKLTPDEREFIMTGITPDEWEETFNG